MDPVYLFFVIAVIIVGILSIATVYFRKRRKEDKLRIQRQLQEDRNRYYARRERSRTNIQQNIQTPPSNNNNPNTMAIQMDPPPMYANGTTDLPPPAYQPPPVYQTEWRGNNNLSS
ncbi:hypothetical protein BDC45DRAFT_530380 [Circinella umbellata]|nr:hypothetical protein BDC45DRAFT_530380 [Circinella umbellata]